MVNIGQIKRGLVNFADHEILNKIPGGFKKVITGTAINLYLKNAENLLAAKKGPFVAALGVVDEQGNVNVDLLADEIKKNIPNEGMRIDIDVMGMHLGDMVLHRADIDNMRAYIINS